MGAQPQQHAAFRGAAALQQPQQTHSRRPRQRRFRYAHHAASPEEEFFADEVYPKHLYAGEFLENSNLRRLPSLEEAQAGARNNNDNRSRHSDHRHQGRDRDDDRGNDDHDDEHDNHTDAHTHGGGRGRRLDDCSDTICQSTVTCLEAQVDYFIRCNQFDSYCPQCKTACACEVEEVDCSWQGTTGATSCGADTEAECYLTTEEHVAAGTAEPFKAVLNRRYLDDACEASETTQSTEAYAHPRVDAEDEATPLPACCFEGQVVDPCFFVYGSDSYSCPYVCKSSDIVTAEKKAFINDRLDWTERYLANLFVTRPLVEPILLDVTKESTRRLGGPSGTAVTFDAGTHLVVIVTAHPSGEYDNVAGFALMLQSQVATLATTAQLGGSSAVDSGRAAQRTIVGHLNICPNVIDVEKLDSLFELASMNRLIMHEMLHLLNAVKPTPTYHATDWGGRRCAEELYVDSTEAWSGVLTRKVITTRTLTVAREQFGCDTLEGASS